MVHRAERARAPLPRALRLRRGLPQGGLVLGLASTSSNEQGVSKVEAVYLTQSRSTALAFYFTGGVRLPLQVCARARGGYQGAADP